jgi:hypothetical protein
LGELPKPEADQLLGTRLAPSLADGKRNRRSGLGVAIAEIGQRRDRIARRRPSGRIATAPVLRLAGSPAPATVSCPELSDDAGGLGPTPAPAMFCPGALRHWQICSIERAEHRKRHLGTDALHGLQRLNQARSCSVAKPYNLINRRA